MEIHYYFSGIGTFKDELLERAVLTCQHRLQSCHAAYFKNAVKWCEVARKVGHKFDMMLDSGAFTAWTKGSEVNLEDLIKDYAFLIDNYSDVMNNVWLINLDKIPGSPGVTATTKELEAAIKISDKNFAILQRTFGNIVLPVFHQNETLDRLREVQAQSEYICVSPRNDLPENQRVLWSEETHAYLQGTKTHGLAATGQNMLARVPWHSVDSASWVFTGSTGNIEIFIEDKLRMIATSSESPNRKEAKQHINTVSDLERQMINQRLNDIGITEEQVVNSHGHRMFVNLHEITAWMERLKKPQYSTPGLFDL